MKYQLNCFLIKILTLTLKYMKHASLLENEEKSVVLSKILHKYFFVRNAVKHICLIFT